MTLDEFFNMGGYAVYVWSSYGLSLVVMLFVFIKPITDRKQILKTLRMKYRQQEKQSQKN